MVSMVRTCIQIGDIYIVIHGDHPEIIDGIAALYKDEATARLMTADAVEEWLDEERDRKNGRMRIVAVPRIDASKVDTLMETVKTCVMAIREQKDKEERGEGRGAYLH